MRFAILLPLVVLVIGGCTRLSDGQAAQLAQARADVEASRMTADAAARSTLLNAAACRLMAGIADLDLPAPETPVSALLAQDGTPDPVNVPAEARAAQASENKPPRGTLGLVLAGIGGVALAALSVIRLSPGAFGTVADLAHQFLAPKATRAVRAASMKSLEVAKEAVAYGRTVTLAAEAAGLGPTVLAIQSEAAKGQDRLGIRAELKTILAGVKAKGGTGTFTRGEHA